MALRQHQVMRQIIHGVVFFVNRGFLRTLMVFAPIVEGGREVMKLCDEENGEVDREVGNFLMLG